ncbi:LysE family translocator [Agrobacterium sp.]|uniref:LysE family translocator n=1 Tax=Agrobacterium sp. TaxID=361 RepID=UPI0028AF2385|nr:LysE family translocator [Agrobacterium sp.]
MMNAELWITFAAACAILFSLPSPLSHRVASYSAIRGKKTILPAITGASTGVVTAMTAAAIPTLGFAYISVSLLEIVQWAGIGWLMLFMLWVFASPAVRLAKADNDNLPFETAGGIFTDCYCQALSPRFIAVFLALLPQFVTAGADNITPLAEMQAGVLLVSLALALAHAVFAEKSLSLARQMSNQKRKPYQRRSYFISGRAVTAGYRRIAA